MENIDVRDYIINNFKDVNDLSEYINQIQLLDAQNDKKTITKLLFKELYNIKTDEATILCFLLERYAEKEEELALKDFYKLRKVSE